MDADVSSLKRYQLLVMGTQSYWYLIKYELIMVLFSNLPGAIGIVTRKALYPLLIQQVGRNVIFGRGVVIRHGLKIRIGNDVVVDDFTVLDAKGEDSAGILIGDGAIVSRNAILSCKNGDITIGSHCMIGINVLIHAIAGSPVFLGDHCLLAAYVYIMGSGTYNTDVRDVPFKDQGVTPLGGITIRENCWVGSGAHVMDGLEIGKGAIVGSGSLVNSSVLPYKVVGGTPAKILRDR